MCVKKVRKKKVQYESRSKHAKKRLRSENGKFMSKKEIAEHRAKELNGEIQESNEAAGVDNTGNETAYIDNSETIAKVINKVGNSMNANKNNVVNDDVNMSKDHSDVFNLDNSINMYNPLMRNDSNIAPSLALQRNPSTLTLMFEQQQQQQQLNSMNTLKSDNQDFD